MQYSKAQKFTDKTPSLGKRSVIDEEIFLFSASRIIVPDCS